MPLARAQALWAMAEPILAAAEQPVDMHTALDLSARHGISAYDAEFLALATALQVFLLTSDRQLLREFPNQARSLDDFAG